MKKKKKSRKAKAKKKQESKEFEKGNSKYARKVGTRKKFVARGGDIQEWREGRRKGEIHI